MNNEEKILSILETLVTKVDTIETKVNNLEVELSETKKEVADTKHRIIAMEQNTNEKFNALFDGYKLLYDISGEIRSDVAKLRAGQDKQELQIKWLDAEKRI